MKVLVAGFFDLFHSGHVAFLEEASKFGDLYVSVGSDENLEKTKNKKAIYSEEERLYIIKNISFVKGAEISKNLVGPESFVPYMDKLDADIFITNGDGATLERKREICKERGIKYVELVRRPKENLKERSSTDISEIDRIPQRLDIVGFYDQKLLNSVYPGSVILANIDTLDLEDRSGMSSSTRHVIRKIFGNRLPKHIDPYELAKIVFAVENPPDRKYISGVVDQLGICLPGINKLNFKDSYWPDNIMSNVDRQVCEWISDHVYLKQTKPRPMGYEVFDGRESFTEDLVRAHSELGEECWRSIDSMDLKSFGEIVSRVHESQKAMIPGYEHESLSLEIQNVRDKHLGVKLMGAGGYGYMMIVTDKPEEDFIKISIRR